MQSTIDRENFAKVMVLFGNIMMDEDVYRKFLSVPVGDHGPRLSKAFRY